MLYQFQWGYRKNGRSLEEYIVWARKELRPTLKRMLGVCKQQDILIPQAVYGFWPANAEGNDVILYDPATQEREVARFPLPRPARAAGLCIADLLRAAPSCQPDLPGLPIAPLGPHPPDLPPGGFT